MTTRSRTARVHRFRDSIAISIGDSETLYLSADMADQISEALEAYAADVRHASFTESQLASTEIEDSEQ